MKHKLTFELGDPSWDGHCLTSTHYITCNYSGLEIEAAYKEMCNKLGFDFLELFSDYQCGSIIPKKYTRILVENNIIGQDRVITEETLSKHSWYDEEDLGTVDMDGEGEYIEIFFNIVKKKLSDLEWNSVTPDYKTLQILEGAGYGLFS